ncbi:hypothetical protein ABEB36_009304 [Hypothenemus hampei]|uniref:Myb/SANT-like DNA-binding domain-containing protein n=1 Tax=Hypothenemus hampei TaxID=57062 RepID=A0ABD1E2N0_HYPHA
MENLMEEELVEISINYKGEDIHVIVPLVEAEVLLNDDEAAKKYVEDILEKENKENENLHEESVKPQADVLSCPEATALFLSLRKKYNDKFKDRKTLKTSLWQKIAIELNDNGYAVTKGREGAEKCRQKFANLQRGYIKFIENMKKTGSEKRNPPPFFEELNEILGCKDKVKPPYLEDSFDECPPSTSSSSSCQLSPTSNRKKITNRFSANTSVRPSTNFQKIINILKDQHEDIQKDRQRYMNVLEDSIKTQNEQRERFLQLLEKSCGNKKRRRNSTSSSE